MAMLRTSHRRTELCCVTLRRGTKRQMIRNISQLHTFCSSVHTDLKPEFPTLVFKNPRDFELYNSH